MRNNPIAIIICLIIIAVTIIAVAERINPATNEILIQDIWIVDTSQSDKWLDFLRENKGRIVIDDVRVHAYFDRDRFKQMLTEQLQKAHDDLQ